MGEHNVEQGIDERKAQRFTKALLDDLHALEYMLEHDRIEGDARRIGAEQEMFLVDRAMRPAPLAVEVLERASDARLTSEIARFNLEANLSPRVLSGQCFREMERELKQLIGQARKSAADFGADVLLAGILPTLQKSDLTLENITPVARYYQLNEAVSRLRGGPFSIHIKGLDELQITHDNIMMESCNTSFQVHVQVGPQEFASQYNIAQAITAPVLAAAVNSPVLFGHRLWQETRLALFQHSADARSQTQTARSKPPRVGFGERWLDKSVLEIFRDQIARFHAIMITTEDENPMAMLAAGQIPPLSALRMHNGTIWPWNRACYGFTNGIAHLRIENRALPSGPTTIDEVANAAFFIGLMSGMPEEYGEISRRLAFDDAKQNLFAAARNGLNAQLAWADGTSYTAPSLILDRLLPLARYGLKKHQVDSGDIDLYLGTVEERVRKAQTGAQWTLKSLAALDDFGSRYSRFQILASTILQRQKEGKPVHDWPVVEVAEPTNWTESYQTVGQFMSTDLFTVRPNDLVDLAASVMEWRHIRHVPVEDEQGHLVGLVTHRGLLRLLTQGLPNERARATTVKDVMKTNPITVTSTTPTLEAMEVMRLNRLGCLPVVDDGQLVGIVTSYDFLEASARIFKQQLTMSARPKTLAAGTA